MITTQIIYDKEAPTSVGATQTPFVVRILCTLLVTGFTHAASLESSVMNPERIEWWVDGAWGKVAQTWLDCFEYFLFGIQLWEWSSIFDKQKKVSKFVRRKQEVRTHSRNQDPRSRFYHLVLTQQEVESIRYPLPSRLLMWPRMRRLASSLVYKEIYLHREP